MSEEEERSSGDEHGARSQGHQRHRGHRRTHGGQRLRKDGRRSRTEAEHVAAVAETPRSSVPMHPKKMFSMRRSGSPVIMTECTAAMVLMDLSCSPAHRGRMSHASGHSGRRCHVCHACHVQCDVMSRGEVLTARCRGQWTAHRCSCIYTSLGDTEL